MRVLRLYCYIIICLIHIQIKSKIMYFYNIFSCIFPALNTSENINQINNPNQDNSIPLFFTKISNLMNNKFYIILILLKMIKKMKKNITILFAKILTKWKNNASQLKIISPKKNIFQRVFIFIHTIIKEKNK